MLTDILESPDCRDNKHGACNKNGWNLTTDTFDHCPCRCHESTR